MRAAPALAALACVCAGSSACVGAAVGTAIDRAVDLATFPVSEYVFQGVYKYDNPWPEPWRSLEPVERECGDELIGLAVSGGGSRAAYFTACVLEQLAQLRATRADGAPGSASVLDEIDYISAVSGGALGSAYYVLERPADSAPEALEAFFERFRADMQLDFELRSLGRASVLFYWLPLLLTYYHRGHLMASCFDANLFHDRSFAQLPEAKPPFPTLILNSTSYSSGNKFLLTRLPSGAFNGSRLYEQLRAMRLTRHGYSDRHRPLENVGFDSIDSDISRYPISYAVVASAAVPNLLGPMVLRDRSRPAAFEVLGDGGIYDNYGLESLLQLFATRLEREPGRRARILLIDGSGYFEEAPQVRRYTDAGYADRTYSIAAQRTADYAEAVCAWMRSLVPQPSGELLPQGEGEPTGAPQSPYRNLSIEVLSLYHQGRGELDAEFAQRDPAARAAGAGGAATESDPVADFVTGLNREVRGIGTRFRLGELEARAIRTQARRVVRQVLAPAASAAAQPASAARPAPERPATELAR